MTTIRVGNVDVDLIDEADSICKLIKTGGSFEADTLERWAEICSTGGTVLDVGAYTGLFSIVAAKLGCEVIAFEPMPANAGRCLSNFTLNDVGVSLRNACVSDTNGRTAIKYNPKVRGLTSGASLIRPSGGRRGEEALHNVETLMIDSLNLTQCTAIKIDVERGEPLVLAGAQDTLARCRPTLLVEVLGEDEKRAVRAAVADYKVVAELDERNWVMVPK